MISQEDEAARLAMEATAQLWGGGGGEGSDFEEAIEQQYSVPVASSISNILNDLSSGGESDVSQSSQSEEEDARMPSLVKANTDTSKLYPIFYKESAKSTGEAGSTSQQQEKEKRFLCSSLPSNQAYIDAGQKELG